MNLYIWPSRNEADRKFVNNGMSVTEWSCGGTRYAAVTDLPEPRTYEIGSLLARQAD